MLYAAHSVRAGKVKAGAKKLTLPWPSLAQIVKPRAGHSIMVVAAPGAGKTEFAVNLAAGLGENSLYVSSDTDEFTMSVQLAALASGHDRETVEQRLETSTDWESTYARSIRQKYGHIVMDFQAGPDMMRVQEMLAALAEVWGDTPHLTVIDTASDLLRSSEDFTGWREQWLSGRQLAREFNTCLLWLHHANQGPAAGGRVAVEQNEGQYKADQFVEVFLSLHREQDNMIVTVQKNRTGKARVPVTLKAEHHKALIREVD